MTVMLRLLDEEKAPEAFRDFVLARARILKGDHSPSLPFEDSWRALLHAVAAQQGLQCILPKRSRIGQPDALVCEVGKGGASFCVADSKKFGFDLEAWFKTPQGIRYTHDHDVLVDMVNKFSFVRRVGTKETPFVGPDDEFVLFESSYAGLANAFEHVSNERLVAFCNWLTERVIGSLVSGDSHAVGSRLGGVARGMFEKLVPLMLDNEHEFQCIATLLRGLGVHDCAPFPRVESEDARLASLFPLAAQIAMGTAMGFMLSWVDNPERFTLNDAVEGRHLPPILGDIYTELAMTSGILKSPEILEFLQELEEILRRARPEIAADPNGLYVAFIQAFCSKSEARKAGIVYHHELLTDAFVARMSAACSENEHSLDHIPIVLWYVSHGPSLHSIVKRTVMGLPPGPAQSDAVARLLRSMRIVERTTASLALAHLQVRHLQKSYRIDESPEIVLWDVSCDTSEVLQDDLEELSHHRKLARHLHDHLAQRDARLDLRGRVLYACPAFNRTKRDIKVLNQVLSSRPDVGVIFWTEALLRGKKNKFPELRLGFQRCYARCTAYMLGGSPQSTQRADQTESGRRDQHVLKHVCLRVSVCLAVIRDVQKDAPMRSVIDLLQPIESEWERIKITPGPRQNKLMELIQGGPTVRRMPSLVPKGTERWVSLDSLYPVTSRVLDLTPLHKNLTFNLGPDDVLIPHKGPPGDHVAVQFLPGLVGYVERRVLRLAQSISENQEMPALELFATQDDEDVRAIDADCVQEQQQWARYPRHLVVSPHTRGDKTGGAITSHLPVNKHVCENGGTRVYLCSELTWQGHQYLDEVGERDVQALADYSIAFFNSPYVQERFAEQFEEKVLLFLASPEGFHDILPLGRRLSNLLDPTCPYEPSEVAAKCCVLLGSDARDYMLDEKWTQPSGDRPKITPSEYPPRPSDAQEDASLPPPVRQIISEFVGGPGVVFARTPVVLFQKSRRLGGHQIMLKRLSYMTPDARKQLGLEPKLRYRQDVLPLNEWMRRMVDAELILPEVDKIMRRELAKFDR